MTADDILGHAKMLMEERGSEAWFSAAQQADAAFARGDREAQRFHWLVLDCIKRLEALAPAAMLH